MTPRGQLTFFQQRHPLSSTSSCLHRATEHPFATTPTNKTLNGFFHNLRNYSICCSCCRSSDILRVWRHTTRNLQLRDRRKWRICLLRYRMRRYLVCFTHRATRLDDVLLTITFAESFSWCILVPFVAISLPASFATQFRFHSIIFSFTLLNTAQLRLHVHTVREIARFLPQPYRHTRFEAISKEFCDALGIPFPFFYNTLYCPTE